MNTLLLLGMLHGVAWSAPPVPPLEDEAALERRIKAVEQELDRLKKQLADRRAKQPVDLLERLEKDYEALARGSTEAEVLQKARQLFARGEAKPALLLLRKARSQAGVPLILHAMLRTARKEKKPDLAAHALTLTLLTGEEVEVRAQDEKAVTALVMGWWLPRKEKITTDPDRFTTQQWTVIARRLRDLAPMPYPEESNGPAYALNMRLYVIIYRYFEKEHSGLWYESDLHPALIPIWLADIGYHPKGSTGPDRYPIRYQLVPLLAALRRNGLAPQLDRIANDDNQNAAVRLTCLLALRTAEEKVRVPALVTILAREKNLERRVAALILLYYAEDLQPAADYLLEALDDPNAEIRQATLYGLRRNPPAKLLPALKQMAEKKHNEQVLTIIAHMKTREAKQYLADYLEKTLGDRPKTERIHDALWAFQTAVGQSWVVAGTSPFAYYHERATTALKWWKEHKND